MNEFKVSVIIPVYNAAKYVQQAVESAIHLEEVGEVILIEDGSPDNAPEVCKSLVRKYPDILLLRHKNGVNKGPGASRNLGIIHASFDYIAFLDADDWYLPNRFHKDKEIFSFHPNANGVYGATGFYYENRSTLDLHKLTTLKIKVSPEELIYNLIEGNAGHFTTNAITLKKVILDKVGFFDEELRLHQDSHLWFRCAIQGKLYAGEIEEAIAVRRVHDNNRISTESIASRRLFYQKLMVSVLQANTADKRVIRFAYINYVKRNDNSLIRRCWDAIYTIVRMPGLLLKIF